MMRNTLEKVKLWIIGEALDIIVGAMCIMIISTMQDFPGKNELIFALVAVFGGGVPIIPLIIFWEEIAQVFGGSNGQR